MKLDWWVSSHYEASGENYNEQTLSHGVGFGVLETLLCVGAFEKTIERGRIRWT